ncbi:MAG: ATP synthase F0 subunit A [Planctomycetota bacterium]|nr:MAG: ATP synthase F0 subunit A [Planctomycetota bacterium]
MADDGQAKAEQAGAPGGEESHAADEHAHAAEHEHEHASHEHADAHGHAHDPFDKNHLIEHVKDATYFDLPRMLGGHWEIPQIRDIEEPIATIGVGFKPLDDRIEPLDAKITKFMVLEVVAAVIMIVFFTALAQRLKKSTAPKGRLTNLLESMVVFIRDEVARPAIGHHDAEKFLPFLLTIFFFVLTCNLLGLLPWAGSATGALATTGALAFATFCTVTFAGMAKLGPVKFWLAQVPHMDLPKPIGFLLKPMIFFIEIMGLLIKHFILAMRLLANMMAGHLVLVVILTFIVAASSAGAVWYAVTPASVLGVVALSLLELFVAFLQAYIFAFLSALFIGMAVHPH